MVLRVLQFVAEDTFVYQTPVASGRKDELRACLIAVMAGGVPVPPVPGQQPGALSNSAVVEPLVAQQCGVVSGQEGWLAAIVGRLIGQLVSFDIRHSTAILLTFY